MGSRLLPLTLALGALLAGLAGLDRLAYYAVLLAVAGAAAAAFVGVCALLEGNGSLLQALTTVLALVLLLVGSVARAGAPVGGRVPTLALSTLVLAALVYGLPLLSWILEPVAAKPRLRPRLRTHP